MAGHGHGRGRGRGQTKSKVNTSQVAPRMSTRAKNATAHPGLVDVSPPASPKGSGAGKLRASNAKAQQARQVGSMSLDEKLKLLEEVTAALNKEQMNNG
ncbi:hypothetical protein PHLCEN_2v9425, partial [Hermanssonia centrifuga]